MPRRKKHPGRRHGSWPRTLRGKAKKGYRKAKRRVKRSVRRIRRKL